MKIPIVHGSLPPGLAANAAALVAVLIWASTYISSKMLLEAFSPIMISLVRFLIGTVFLMLLAPPKNLRVSWKSEIPYAAAGFLGIFLYNSLENLATKNTYASNVSIIVTTIPFLTALFSSSSGGRRVFTFRFTASTAASFSGVAFIIFSGTGFAGFSPAGDITALIAAAVFASYTIILKRIGPDESGTVIARKTVSWGFVFIVLFSLVSGNLPEPRAVVSVKYLPHFLFLGLLASGLCYVLWSGATAVLGAVRTSRYIYFVPVVTTALSAVLLGETITVAKVLGMFLIVSGAFLSSEPAERGGQTSASRVKAE